MVLYYLSNENGLATLVQFKTILPESGDPRSRNQTVLEIAPRLRIADLLEEAAPTLIRIVRHGIILHCRVVLFSIVQRILHSSYAV